MVAFEEGEETAIATAATGAKIAIVLTPTFPDMHSKYSHDFTRADFFTCADCVACVPGGGVD
eukprot:CAMPEP_0182440350 /NCGR_PEP_ID=MMETSP1167-20130531/87010_1 /TAXON_ID=2988 /ORGANISM="Mallomonas Sp, Strain CCMP3275" /LENGTH=61 /DNA_ID=CAMNT_0024634285 /DNA_START=271 /DNA_END=456 /DNA_ORIENTATION=+